MKEIKKLLFIVLIAITLCIPSFVNADLDSDPNNDPNTTDPTTNEDESTNENETEGITNDLNNDGIVNKDDVDLLEDKLLKDDISSEEEPNLDVNKDEDVDIKDLVNLDNIVKGEQETGETSKASFNVKTKQNKNIVSYKVYLTTDGIVRSFMFDIAKTNNLKLLYVEVEKDILFSDPSDKTRFIGLGDFIEGDLLVTIYYKLTNYNKGILTLLNGMIVYDNLNCYKDIPIYKNTFKLSKSIIKNNSKKINNIVYYPVYLTNNITSNNDNKDNKQNNQEPEPSDQNSFKKDKKENNKKQEKSDKTLKSIIKISLIVLLGAVIIYLLNNEKEKEEIEKK